MGVHVIPHDQDPRAKVPATFKRFRFDPKNFPPLPPVTRTTATEYDDQGSFAHLGDSKDKLTHTFAEVVLDKHIAEETVLDNAVAEEEFSEEGLREEEVHKEELSGDTGTDTAVADEEDSIVALASPSFSRFMELPVEIREFIWEHAMRGTLHVADRHGSMRAYYLNSPVEVREFVAASRNTEWPSFLPAMCRTSKLTMKESIGVYIRYSHFMIASIKDNRLLDGFLQTVDHGYEAIQSIHFAFFDCFPVGFAQNADLELAVRCTGLRTIKLSFHWSQLTTITYGEPYLDEEDQRGPRSVENMWSHYKLARILDCDKLHTLIIEKKGRMDTDSISAANGIGSRIQAEYLSRHNRSLDLSYTSAARVLRHYY